MSSYLIEDHQVINLCVPAADRFAGTLTSDEVKLDRYNHASFILYTGANAAGDTIVTVESCSDASGSNNTAIAYDYAETTGGGTLTNRDVWGSLTAATSSGHRFFNNSAANRVGIIEVKAAALSATSNTQHEYVRIICTESANNAITGGIICILSEPRYARDGKSTCLG